MSHSDGVKPERDYHYVLTCPCGEGLVGDSEDLIVEAATAHLRDRHPDMADEYGRDEILFMAIQLPK